MVEVRIMKVSPVQSRFAETRFAETPTLTLNLTLTLNPNFGESSFGESGFDETGFGESGRHRFTIR